MAINVSGESHGHRDSGLLESAVLRPESAFGGVDIYLDIFLKTGAPIHSFLINHFFWMVISGHLCSLL